MADTPAPESLEDERKTVTMLFADIKGSMELIEDLDPEEARAIVDPALKLMMEAVHHYEGYVAQSTGDGIFALFGAPIAHEDHPQRALFAALRMQQELKRYSSRTRAEGRLPIQVRVGVNTGEVVVRAIKTGEGHTEYAPIGHSTSLAARMQALAPIGSIATTELVRKLCDGYFAFAALGPTKVKGVSEPVSVYEVTGLGLLRTRLQRSASRGYTKFVGRELEMEALRHAAEQARAGRGQIVAVVAEPGVGKSRLLDEFKTRNQSGWMVLEAPAVAYGKASAFLPLIDLLRNYFKITSEDDERTRREKVAGKIAILDRSLEDALPYLYGLLGLGDSQIAEVEALTRKRRALDAVKRIILRESLNQPLIVIFEDLHWIDEESQVFLNLLADSIGTAKVLLLVNYRPEYRHEWGNKTYYTQLRLDPLGNASGEEMLLSSLGDSGELARLRRLIIEKTEGNPLFMEETVQMLFEEGALARNGVVRLTRSLNQLAIPATVQDILASRIDRLPSEQKELLQMLAVIGTEFRLAVVHSLIELQDQDLERRLAALQLSEFIYEQPASGDVEYVFKHALTRDVAYKSVLNERRRLLHERTGDALESLYAGSLDDQLAQLAHHYARSGNPNKAVGYCLRACRQCLERGSYADAVAHFETGLARLRELPDDDRRAELEIDLRIASQPALATIKGYGSLEGEASASRALELCRRPGTDWKDLWLALRGFHGIVGVRPDLHRALEIAAEMVALAERHESAAHLAQALYLRAFTNMKAGAFDLAAVDFDRTIAIFESTSTAGRAPLSVHINPATARVLRAWNQCYLGYLNQALEGIEAATAIARESNFPRGTLETLYAFSISVYDLRSEFEQMRERAEATANLSIELGNPFHRAIAEICRGWTEVVSGELENGVARMRQNLAAFRATGSETSVDNSLALIATALGRMGQFDEALRTIEEAFDVIQRTDERCCEAEVYRRKGELLLAQDSSNFGPAEQCFRTSIDVARKQHAKLWELRATTSLARLLDKQGKRHDARVMLSDIYGWFTEGFDTADLKDANALLDELSA